MDTEQIGDKFEQWCAAYGFPFRRVAAGRYWASVSTPQDSWLLVCEIEGCGIHFWSVFPIEVTKGNSEMIKAHIAQAKDKTTPQGLGLDPILDQIRCGDGVVLHGENATAATICDSLLMHLADAADHLAALRLVADNAG